MSDAEHDLLDHIGRQVTATRTELGEMRAELGGPGGVRERLTRIESKMPAQPCAELRTHIELHKQREAADLRKTNRVWDIAKQFLSPVALLAALAALVKIHWPGGHP